MSAHYGIGKTGEIHQSAFHRSADSGTLVYEYLPASGYRLVRAYDVQSKEGLVVPRSERGSSRLITFERWGGRPREIILGVTDVRTKERRTATVTLVHRSNPRQVEKNPALVDLVEFLLEYV